MPVTACVFVYESVCVHGEGGKKNKEPSLFYTLTGNKSASSRINMLRLTCPVRHIHQAARVRVRVCMCVRVTERDEQAAAAKE